MKEKVLKATTQKSYYGKDHYYEYENAVYLRSYGTTVCRIIDGEFQRLWSGFSKTTLNHVNDFRKLYGMEPLNKKGWLSIPCDGERYRVTTTNIVGYTRRFGQIFSSYDEAENFIYKLQERNPYYIGCYDIEIEEC